MPLFLTGGSFIMRFILILLLASSCSTAQKDLCEDYFLDGIRAFFGGCEINPLVRFLGGMDDEGL